MKWFHVFGLAVILIIAVLLIYNAFYFPKVAQREVSAEIAKLKASGQPVSPEQLSGWRPSFKNNAAQFYGELFYRMRPGDVREDLGRLWLSHQDEQTYKERYFLSTRAASILEQYKPFLLEIEKAASMPRCEFPLTWQDWKLRRSIEGIRTLDLSDMRLLADLVTAKAVVSARDHKMSEAMHWIDVAFRMAESMKDGQTIESQETRYAVLDTAVRGLRDVVYHGSPDNKDLLTLDRTLEQIDLKPALALGLRTKRAMAVSAYEEQTKRGRYFYPTELFIIEYLNYFEQASRLDYRQIDRFRLAQNALLGSWFVRSTAWVAIPIPRMLSYRDTRHAKVREARVLLAAMRYKNRFGSYPGSAGQLETKLDWRVPEDPFSGKPLIYKRRGAGFVVYSIGPNMIDDGGSELRRLTDGDVVMTAPRRG